MLVEYELAAFEKVKCKLMRIKWGLDKWLFIIEGVGVVCGVGRVVAG